MRRALWSVAGAVVVSGLFAGCGPEKLTAPPAGKASRGRTQIFTRLAAKPDAPDALKAHFQSKFPDLDFRTWSSGATTIRPNTDEPTLMHLELQLIVSRQNEKSQDMETAYPRLLGELEQYLKALATSTGAEVAGPVQDKSRDGKRVGFQFEYRTPDNSGFVLVEPQAKVAGGLIVVVEERE